MEEPDLPRQPLFTKLSTVRVEASTRYAKREAFGMFALMASILVGSLVTCFSGGKEWTGLATVIVFFYLPGTAIALSKWVGEARRQGSGAIATDEGVGATMNSETLWIVPWSQLGGYRANQLGFWESVLHPERSVTILLNRQGVEVGVLPMAPHARPSKPALRVAADGFWKFVDSHLPDDPLIEHRDAYQKVRQYSAAKAGAFVAVGLILTIGGLSFCQFLAELAANNRAYAPAILLSYFAFLIVGIVTTFHGHIAFAVRKRPATAWTRPSVPQAEEEGVSLFEHRLTRSQEAKDSDFDGDGRFKIAGPSELRKEIEATLKNAKPVRWLSLAILTLFTVLILSDPTSIKNGSLVALAALFAFFGPLTIATELSAKQSRQHLETLDDVVLVEGDSVVVCTKDGRHIAFTKAAKRRRSLLNKNLESLREGRNFYYLDRAHLHRVDHQEDYLRELETICQTSASTHPEAEAPPKA